ncbi:adenylate/guanylate cyclase domain-containing protein [Actinocorallia sp. A-T 12471]|uniref:adenylate/guanylate cyclase domain-containing protein n=1 Tax=Actinocorallia sp. A-T 12471 TaxID=3089813 RepID=UPI0029CEF7D0|nr:adenylate/guanylate cyclase domain-containing protein [Actinocorallia sp. A-T 12471]MDX6742019.1 adenylate/guanylate cyclase domain-containing protein [Actinocorallia sp. A-T 12471]
MTDAREVEELLLGEPLAHTMTDMEELSGLDAEIGLRLWSALGFPTPAPDEIAFTEEDVIALGQIRALLDHPYVDEEMVLRVARGVGQAMNRLASRVAELWLERLAEQLVKPGEAADEDAVVAALTASAELRPKFERLLLRAWRRQLSAAGVRAFGAAADATADAGTGTAQVSVGFADIVSFTRLSRRLGPSGLASLVDRFETGTATIIAEEGGRVIKTLGDEVLFTAPTAEAAAEIGLRISDWSAAEDFPDTRVGLASGEVILRLGDVFGTPVNLAARLTSAARPGTVLAAPDLAAELSATGNYALRKLGSRPLQGIGKVRPYLVRRHSSDRPQLTST